MSRDKHNETVKSDTDNTALAAANDDGADALICDEITENAGDKSWREKSDGARSDEIGAQASTAADENTDEPPHEVFMPQRKRKPIIKSVAARTAVNYIIFSMILLVLLWAVFFFGVYGFYGTMIERETDEIIHAASDAFPKRYDDNSMKIFFKTRLAEIAKNNKPVAIAVFTIDGDDYDVQVVIDDMGIGSDNNDLFDSVMSGLNFENVFESHAFGKVSTDYGTFLCRGDVYYPATENGTQMTFMLVMKPYDVFNSQTLKLLMMFIIGTLTVLVLACIFSFLASRFQTKRLKDFSSRAKRVAAGDYTVRFSGGGYNEYENLAVALNAATDNLKKSEKLQRDIIANVSHDIRTPLTMIRANAEMIRDLPLDEAKRNKTAGVIIAEADRLAGLVNDVLNYSKLQSGVTGFDFAPYDFSQIASEVLDRFDIIRTRDGIKFVREIEPNAVARCDKQKIEQVLYNLISNAINYCGEDKTVIIRVLKADGKVRVEVSDHGRGIEQNELDSVWDRYYRSEHSTRTVVGTGLGLSICKSILIAHDAEYGVLSELGKGSTFWFEVTTSKMRGGGA